MPQDISFYSEGERIAAKLFLPEGASQDATFPGIVLCHGFAGIQEVLLPPYAEAFAQNGFVALTFDYRGFGGSEGSRGHLVPSKQVADIRNAITALLAMPQVDRSRIGLWGTSFGGANALATGAIDRRVKAVVAQLTFSSGFRAIKGKLDEQQQDDLDATIAKAWEREVVKNRPLSLNPAQLLGNEEAREFYEGVMRDFPESNVKIPMTVLQHILEVEPAEAIEKLSCPVLIVAAGSDTLCPPKESEILFERAREPKKLVVLEGCRHFEAYAGEQFAKSSAAAIEWFQRAFG